MFDHDLTDPHEVGLNHDRLAAIPAYFKENYLDTGKLPCMATLISRNGEVALEDYTGTTELGGGTPHPDYPLDGVSLAPVLADPAATFARPMHWRMNHRQQRAYRDGDWKYLKVDDHEYLFDIRADARERANLGPRQPGRLAAMREAWLAWDATMPPIPEDASVSLGYSAKDMPQR